MAEEKKLIWVPTPALTRRKFLIAGSAAAFLAACGGDDDDDEATSTTAPPGTAAPATTGAPGTTTGATTAPGGTAPMGIRGGILRVGTLGGANDLLDGQHIIGKSDIARQATGWEPLLNYDPDYNVVNTDALAEELETIAADHYVVRLREGLMFWDGSPVRAEDVIYSFTRMLDPEQAVFGGSALRPILDATGLTKVDDRTVDIQLKQLVANFNEALCAYTTTIVPEGYTRFEGDPSTQNGTGPFKLQEFEVGVQSIHTRNENYWQPDKPYFDEVHIIDFADNDAMINALLADQIDCAQDIPSTAVDTLGNQGFSVLNAEGGGWLTIIMAVDQEPFTDVRARQAMR
ncbi:MAG TPA: ABC transporter substrate-binding protein, partial [Ilumatobacter sp.]|nr:ABC transporter substrate-binding protein [Ilumatobacter sp.]